MLLRKLLARVRTRLNARKAASAESDIDDELLFHLRSLVDENVARGLPPQRLAGIKLETRFARIRNHLAKEVTANFAQPTPLPRIAAFLSQRAGVKVVVDGVALRRVGFDPSEGVTLTTDKEPLIEALARLCRSARGERVTMPPALRTRIEGMLGAAELLPATEPPLPRPQG